MQIVTFHLLNLYKGHSSLIAMQSGLPKKKKKLYVSVENY